MYIIQIQSVYFSCYCEYRACAAHFLRVLHPGHALRIPRAFSLLRMRPTSLTRSPQWACALHPSRELLTAHAPYITHAFSLVGMRPTSLTRSPQWACALHPSRVLHTAHARCIPHAVFPEQPCQLRCAQSLCTGGCAAPRLGGTHSV